MRSRIQGNKKGILIFLLVVSALLLISYLYLDSGREKPLKVSVVVEGRSSENWEVLRQGMENFSEEKPVELNFLTLSPEESTGEKLEMIRREIHSGSEGMIFYLPEESSLLRGINENLGSVRKMVIGSELTELAEHRLCLPDYRAMGEALAAEVLYRSAASGAADIGVISGNVQMNAQKRLTESVGRALGSRLLFTAADADAVTPELMQRSNVLICLDAESGQRMLDRQGSEIKQIYVVGRTEKLVSALDKGRIQLLLVPDDFVMGYTALRNLYTELRQGRAVRQTNVPWYMVDKSRLFSPELEPIMFPFVQ